MKTKWSLVVLAFIVLTLLQFSPALLSSEIEPTLWGLPRTLWSGFLFSAGYTVLIYLGIKAVGKGNEQ